MTRSKASRAILQSLFLATISLLAACGNPGVGPVQQVPQAQGYQPAFGQPSTSAATQTAQEASGQALAPPADPQAQVLTAQQSRARDVEVTIQAPVYKLLPDDTRGKQHQRFLLQLNNGSTVLVAHNIDLAPRVPLQRGDMVTIHGEYIWNNKGGVLHYTHHSTNPMHPSGWIDFSGKRYQ